MCSNNLEYFDHQDAEGIQKVAIATIKVKKLEVKINIEFKKGVGIAIKVKKQVGR